MKTFMTVFDIFDIPDKGIIIAGVNPKLDYMEPNDFKGFIGRFIEIHNPDSSTVNSVIKDLKVTSSLIDQKNIFILLESSIDKEEIQKEAVVCIV